MNTKLKIPASLIELTAELMSNQETANGINMIFNELTKDFILFQTPVGNKKDVAASWLRSIGKCQASCHCF